MPGIPKGHKVLDTVKDKKGFYRIIQRPDGTKYTQTLKLFTQDDLDRKVNADNKALGQYSVKNIEGNVANAMALTAVGGGAATLALHNLTQGRQGKVGRKVRGAAFGNTRPQGTGLKTQAGSAGDVRGRVSPDRPPAIVRSVDSVNKGGSKMPQTGFDKTATAAGNSNTKGLQKLSETLYGSDGGSKMPQTGDLFTQPEAPKTGAKGGTKGGTKGGSGTKPTGSGTRASGSGTRTSGSAGAKPTGSMPQQFNQMRGASGGTASGRTNVAIPSTKAQMARTFRQGQGGTGSGRTNVQAAVDKTVGRTQSGATSRPTGTNRYSQVTAGQGLAGATPSRGAIATTSNTNPNARAAGVPTTNRPGSPPPSPVRSSASVGRPGTELMRPIPEAKFRVIPPQPKPTGGLLGKGLKFIKGSGPMMAAGHLLEDAVSGVQSAAQGDWKNAGRRALDLVGHGPWGPAGFVANDIVDIARGQKIIRGKPTRIGDRIVHGKIFPDRYYADDEAPKATRTPAASGGNKPAGGTSQRPSGPAYFPEAGRNGSAVRTPDSYLGEAFDYSLQKGTTSGTKYLEHMFRRDKISEDDQQRLRERFNKKVVGDQTLKTYGADKGITQDVEGKQAGLGSALLNKYRDTGSYKGNTDYGTMRAAAEARLAASKK